MQIIIESAEENGKIPEWGLLEFQGSFLTREKQPIHGEFMGDLNYTLDGTPFFIVGHHILYGEEVKLPKPLAVLNKETDEVTNMKKYLVRAVIRKKVLFKTRPKPIICQQAQRFLRELCKVFLYRFIRIRALIGFPHRGKKSISVVPMRDMYTAAGLRFFHTNRHFEIPEGTVTEAYEAEHIRKNQLFK